MPDDSSQSLPHLNKTDSASDSSTIPVDDLSPEPAATHDPSPESAATHDPSPESAAAHDLSPESAAAHDLSPESAAAHDPLPEPGTSRDLANPDVVATTSRTRVLAAVVTASVLAVLLACLALTILYFDSLGKFFVPVVATSLIIFLVCIVKFCTAASTERTIATASELEESRDLQREVAPEISQDLQQGVVTPQREESDQPGQVQGSSQPQDTAGSDTRAVGRDSSEATLSRSGGTSQSSAIRTDREHEMSVSPTSLCTDGDCGGVLLSFIPVKRSSIKQNASTQGVFDIWNSGQELRSLMFFSSRKNTLYVLDRCGNPFKITDMRVMPPGATDEEILQARKSPYWAFIRPRFGNRGIEIKGMHVGYDCGLWTFESTFSFSLSYRGKIEHVIKRMTFGPNFPNASSNVEIRVALLARYIALQRSLASEVLEAPVFTLSDDQIAEFIYSPSGARFGRDILDHYTAFEDTVYSSHRRISEEDREFLKSALNVIDSFGGQGIPSQGTPEGTMCMLYLLSDDVPLSSLIERNPPEYKEKQCVKDAVCYFLADQGFRSALIAIVMRRALAVMRKLDGSGLGSERWADSQSPVSTMKQRIEKKIPFICTKIPGLIESVTTAVLGCCLRGGNTSNDANEDIVCQLLVMRNFAVAARRMFHNDKTASWVETHAQYSLLCDETADAGHIRPLLVASAASTHSRKMFVGQRTKEDFFKDAVLKYNAGRKIPMDLRGRIAIAEDHVPKIKNLDEVVAHTVASELTRMLGNERGNPSLIAFECIAEDVNRYIAEFLRGIDPDYTPPLASIISGRVQGMFCPMGVQGLTIAGSVPRELLDVLVTLYPAQHSEKSAHSTLPVSAEGTESVVSQQQPVSPPSPQAVRRGSESAEDEQQHSEKSAHSTLPVSAEGTESVVSQQQPVSPPSPQAVRRGSESAGEDFFEDVLLSFVMVETTRIHVSQFEAAPRVFRMLQGTEPVRSPEFLVIGGDKIYMLAQAQDGDVHLFKCSGITRRYVTMRDSSSIGGDAWVCVRFSGILPESVTGIMHRAFRYTVAGKNCALRMTDSDASAREFANDIKLYVLKPTAPAPLNEKVTKGYFSRYLGLQRQLILDFYNHSRQSLGQAPLSVLPTSELEQFLPEFMNSPVGLNFASDLTYYNENFSEALQKGDSIGLSGEDHAFLVSALSALSQVDQQALQFNTGVPTEVMCSIYTFSGGTLPFSASGARVLNQGLTELVCGFLGNQAFRRALVSRALQEVIASYDSGEDSVISQICACIPGVVESAKIVLEAFGFQGSAKQCGTTDNPGMQAQMHIIPGFSETGPGVTSAFMREGILKLHDFVTSEPLGNDSVAYMQSALLAANSTAALALARQEQGAGTDHAAVISKLPDSSSYRDLSVRMCSTRIKECISELRYEHLEEVIANAFASEVSSMLGRTQQCSKDALTGISRNTDIFTVKLLTNRAHSATYDDFSLASALGLGFTENFAACNPRVIGASANLRDGLGKHAFCSHISFFETASQKVTDAAASQDRQQVAGNADYLSSTISAGSSKSDEADAEPAVIKFAEAPGHVTAALASGEDISRGEFPEFPTHATAGDTLSDGASTASTSRSASNSSLGDSALMEPLSLNASSADSVGSSFTERIGTTALPQGSASALGSSIPPHEAPRTILDISSTSAAQSTPSDHAMRLHGEGAASVSKMNAQRFTSRDALKESDNTNSFRILLVLTEFDPDKLQDTNPIKQKMLVGAANFNSEIRFYQQRVEGASYGIETFCTMYGRSFRVSSRAHAIPPSRHISSVMNSIDYSPRDTIIVVQAPKMRSGTSPVDGTLAFCGQEFDIKDLKFPAVHKADYHSFMLMMLYGYISYSGGEDRLGCRSFDTYIRLQQQLVSDFAASSEERGDALIPAGEEITRFISSPAGSRIVNDVSNYVQLFLDVCAAMPESDAKEFLDAVIKSVLTLGEQKGDADQGTPAETLCALHALSSAHYIPTASARNENAIISKFLSDDEFGLALIMATAESLVTSMLKIAEDARDHGITPSVKSITPRELPQICLCIPGLLASVFELLRELMINVEGGDRLHANILNQLSIVTQAHCLQEGSSDEPTPSMIKSIRADDMLDQNEISHVRNAVTVLAKRKAIESVKNSADQKACAPSKEDLYDDIINGFLEGSGKVPDVAKCEQLIGESVAYLSTDREHIEELVADSVARRVSSKFLKSGTPFSGGMVGFMNALKGRFLRHEPLSDIESFADDVKACSSDVISKFLAEGREILREGFFPSVMSNYVHVQSEIERETSPCAVSVYMPVHQSDLAATLQPGKGVSSALTNTSMQSR
ncbi:hypothetical protein [Anaplasma capra]|uniref:hypothetical protein n=1 Tax=Anaplasma capra TaxID=1562740 RepID=UPI0021D608F5|nr:hypothetical protein [Anaplasma capra]